MGKLTARDRSRAGLDLHALRSWRRPFPSGAIARSSFGWSVLVLITMMVAVASCKRKPDPTVSATTASDSAAVPVAIIPSASPALPSASPEPRRLADDMVLVPAGSFTMGDDESKVAGPAHKVRMSKPFYIDQYEVRVDDYGRCVAAGACTPAEVHGPNVAAAEVEKFGTMCNARYPDREDHPVNCVDRAQAEAYCKFASKRLPTEGEWEYAARGSDERQYPWGNDAPGCNRAVVSGCVRRVPGKASTQPIGSLRRGKSPFGAHDMAGNVWEWVADAWDEDAYKSPNQVDPKVEGPGTFGVLRGGSWDFAPSNLASHFRLKFNHKIGHVSTGIRCAQDASARSPVRTAAGPGVGKAGSGGVAASVAALKTTWNLKAPITGAPVISADIEVKGDMFLVEFSTTQNVGLLGKVDSQGVVRRLSVLVSETRVLADSAGLRSMKTLFLVVDSEMTSAVQTTLLGQLGVTKAPARPGQASANGFSYILDVEKETSFLDLEARLSTDTGK